jgi:ubiquinone/menaquinone biosynthesis C-methylase UbiE
MPHRVCPWWIGYLLACPLRRWLQDPVAILGPYVREGMTVLEPGPGMGFFTLDLARLAGPAGRVIAVDLQPRMLAALKRRAARAGVSDRIETRVAAPGSMNVADLAGTVDFTLAAAVVHELPAPGPFFAEVAAASKRGASVLLIEPSSHVKPADFDAELAAAAAAGLKLVGNPSVRGGRAALLEKS